MLAEVANQNPQKEISNQFVGLSRLCSLQAAIPAWVRKPESGTLRDAPIADTNLGNSTSNSKAGERKMVGCVEVEYGFKEIRPGTTLRSGRDTRTPGFRRSGA